MHMHSSACNNRTCTAKSNKMSHFILMLNIQIDAERQKPLICYSVSVRQHQIVLLASHMKQTFPLHAYYAYLDRCFTIMRYSYPINSKITRGLNFFFLPKIAGYFRVRIIFECGLNSFFLFFFDQKQMLIRRSKRVYHGDFTFSSCQSFKIF